MTDVAAPNGPRIAPSVHRGLVLPVALLAAWELSSRLGLADPRFLPPLEIIARSGWHEMMEGRLWGDLLASLRRDLSGFGLGATIGIALGTVLGLSRLADRILTPWFNGLKQIALVAWIPLISMWFGFDEAAKVVFVALAACIPVVLNTQEGVRAAPLPLIEVGRTLRFSRTQFLLRLHLPAALPSILTGLHLGLIYAWLATVGAEYFMAVGPGIGGLIIAGRERFDMPLVLLGILILGCIGFAIDRMAGWIEHRLIRWH
ncbi:ABC transporter permease [Chelatococcus asaccharovorans]|uniref:Sulfonate transport system permease protein n=1 Tax=Chelatococcus asaccharovorans TaxID=28210 RepID=A0A2V3U5F1_9HYPH|nr:ABC transporter permease [Chelatococcus asaccharovorans]MBS7703777.1 ABC transporter permease [Chelatococcus asaccharovorans]PXW57937.1 sulfonate transport system permease protein [Chelatococcus asaccharovorans]